MIKKKMVQVFGYNEYLNNADSIPGSLPAQKMSIVKILSVISDHPLKSDR